jgi:hypothetical protein
VHAVRADQDVVDIGRAVGEGGSNPRSVVVECSNRHAEADGNPLAQELVERAVADGDARPSRTPDAAQVDVEQHAPALVEEQLPLDLVRAVQKRRL